MGLLARAEKDLETGPAKPRQGLFAKANKALAAAPAAIPDPGLMEIHVTAAEEPETLPEPPLEVRDLPALASAEPETEAEDLEPLAEPSPPLPRPHQPALALSTFEALGADIRGLSRSYDADLAVFARLAEVLPLEGLALLFVREARLELAAVHGQFFSRDLNHLDLPASVDLLAEKGILGKAAVEALGGLILEDNPPSIYAHPVAATPGSGAYLWLAASPDFAMDARLGEEFSRVLAWAPRPPREICLPPILSPREAAESIKLGSGSAALHLLNLGKDFSFLRKAASESAVSYSSGLVVTAASALVGEEGGAYLLKNGRLAILSYSHRETDIELSRTQFRKSLKKALPFLFSTGLPEGTSLSLDRSLASALEIFERLVSE